MTVPNFGPSISFSKKLFDDKMTLRYMPSYIKSGETIGVFNNRFSGSYKIAKNQKLNFSLGMMNRRDSANSDNSFSELRATTGYSLSF